MNTESPETSARRSSELTLRRFVDVPREKAFTDQLEALVAKL